MSSTSAPARCGSTKSARTTTACGCTGPPTCTSSSVADEVGDRRHRVRHRHVGDAIEHEAHGPVLAVLAEQDDRATEVGVEERRAGDEELTAERAHRTILARPDAAGRARGAEVFGYARTRIVNCLLIGAPLSEKA